MIRKVEVERFSLTSSKPFDQVAGALDAAIGHPDMAEFVRSTHEARSFAELKSSVERGLGKSGLMLFMSLDHGAVCIGHALQVVGGVVRIFPDVASVVRRLNDSICSVILKSNSVAGRRNQLFQFSLLIPFQLNSMTVSILHLVRSSLRKRFAVVCLGKKETTAIAKIQSPAVAIPGVLRPVEFRRRRVVPEDRVGVACSLGNSRKMNLPGILQI
jgi:hypothetical protein